MTPSWARGLAILAERQAGLAAAVEEALIAPLALPSFDDVRAVVTTGVGSSLGHARYLAWLLRSRGIAAWDLPTGSWLAPPDGGAREQALVVFSQGLSPNARFPLAHVGAYARTVLVTAADADAPERAAAVAVARAAGASVVPLGCAPEYEVLLRIVGPLVGYATALRLAGIAVAPEAIAGAVRAASARSFAGLDPAILGEPMTLVTTHGHGAFAHNLAAKVQEGMFLPWPAVVDALELAHGTIQEAAGKPRTFVALTSGAPLEAPLLARARALLEPQHRWLELRATLPGALAIFEHEVLLNGLVLAAIGARRLDQVAWPGKGRDGPLYEVASTRDLAPAPPAPSPPPRNASCRLADLTWPEIEARIAAGARTAVVPLGATEQHGPHLPLDVDARIAEALAERFCARMPEALVAPVVAVGCSVEHMGFSGTLSVREETLGALVSDLVGALVSHGFDHVVVFSAHGGNDALLGRLAGPLQAQVAPARVTVVHGIDALGRTWQEASAREGVSAMASGQHAGEYETSIYAALRPDAVRWTELRPGIDGAVPDPQSLFYPSLRDHAPEGVVGDPRAASAERAWRYLEAWTDRLLDAAISPSR